MSTWRVWGQDLVSKPDPLRGGGAPEERVWAHAYIRVVLTECNYAWLLAINCDTTRTITVDLLVALLDFCQTLAGNAARYSDLSCLVAGDTESLEKNHFLDVIRNQRF